MESNPYQEVWGLSSNLQCCLNWICLVFSRLERCRDFCEDSDREKPGPLLQGFRMKPPSA